MSMKNSGKTIGNRNRDIRNNDEKIKLGGGTMKEGTRLRALGYAEQVTNTELTKSRVLKIGIFWAKFRAKF